MISIASVPSGVQNLRDLIRYTKEDPRESPAFYDSCSTFESALSRPGLKSPSYLDAKARLDRSRELIDVELRKHSAHGIVVLSAGSKLLGHAGLPQVTVPLGFLSESVPIVPAVVTNRMGETRDAPLRLLQTHPNQ